MSFLCLSFITQSMEYWSHAAAECNSDKRSPFCEKNTSHVKTSTKDDITIGKIYLMLFFAISPTLAK